MDISCDIIRDLLPLYAEDLVSEDSRKLVDEHLCSCDPCTKQLGILKKAAVLPIEVETTSLKRVEHTIRRRKVLTVATAIMTVFTLIVTGFVFMLTPVFLTADQAIEGVELREDGGLAIDYARGVVGISGVATNEEGGNWGIMCYTTRYDWLVAKAEDRKIANMTQEELEAYILDKYKAEEMTQKIWDRFHSIHVEYGTWTLPNGEHLHQFNPEIWVDGNGEWTHRRSEVNHWYMNIHTGDLETILWDADRKTGENLFARSSYEYAVLLFACMILTIIFVFYSRKRNGWKKEISERTAILCTCSVFSTILVTGGNLVIGETLMSTEWPRFIFTEVLVLSLTALLWHQLHRLNKQDRGM